MQNELLYKGDSLTVTASQLVTKNTIAGGLPLSGELAVLGDIVGVTATSALAATDLIAFKTKGVFNLPVVGTNGANTAVTAGQRVYVNSATGQIDITAANTFAGWALAPVNAGATTTVAVKLKH